MKSSVDTKVLENGQLAFATKAIDGDLLSSDGSTGEHCLVKTSNGVQRAVKIYDILSGAEPSSKGVLRLLRYFPAASAENSGKVYMYIGKTDSDFTHGYIYENVKTASYTASVSFSPDSIACAGNDFLSFLQEHYIEVQDITNGSMTYFADAELWRFVAKKEDGSVAFSWQQYEQDFVDAGFSFTGTFTDGEVVEWTTTITETSASYAWTQINVQP